MEDTNVSLPTRSRAPGHRACIPCARAKAGCVLVPGLDGKCERCVRLQKTCEQAVVRERTRTRRTGETRAYVKKLEEKLDGLVSLIQSRELGAEAQSSSFGDPTVHDHLNKSSGSHEMGSDAYLDSSIAASSMLNTGSYSTESVSTPPSSHPVDEMLSAQEVEMFLNIFKNEMCPSFPFIRLEESVTATDLRRDRPFFFLCIMAITSGNTDQKNVMTNLVMETLASRMYVHTERDLDMLLGILTYIAWSYHLVMYKGQKTALFASASVLINDLELNRPSRMKASANDTNLFEAAVPSTSQFRLKIKSFETVEHTPEVRRALLAYFYLSSIASSLLYTAEPPRVTKYIEDCYQVLSASNDPNDEHACALVESQLIVERMNQAPWNGESPLSTTPSVFFVKTIQEQLRMFRAKRADQIQRSFKLSLVCDYMDIYLYKIGLFPAYSAELGPIAPSFERLELVYSCLLAVKSFFDTFLATPPNKFRSLSMPDTCLFRHSLFTSHKLVTFEHPDWNLDSCRQTISLCDLLGKLAVQFEQAAVVLGFDTHKPEKQDWFTRGGKHLHRVKDYWEKKEAAELEVNRDNTFPAYPQIGDIDLLDDAFMMDVLGSWDDQNFAYQSFG